MKETKRKRSGQTRLVNWKLLFNQLFALEIKKEYVLNGPQETTEERFDHLLRAYTLYTPESFNDVIDKILSAETSDEAYEVRTALYEDILNRQLIAEPDFSQSIKEDLLEHPQIHQFLENIEKTQERPIADEENFFGSPEGQNVINAFCQGPDSEDQEVALVFVPGFAGHTIKYDLFEEIVQDINIFYGRPQSRPLHSEEGIELEFEDHNTFYSRSSQKTGSFDILQPAGKELGNTTGLNAETTDCLAQWIRSLPESYAKKKLILFGYSKGAPIVLELVHRHPDLSHRILGYVTYAGVVQGTHVARLAIEQANTYLRDVPMGEFVDQLRSEEPLSLGKVLSPLFSDIDLSWLSVPRIRAVFDMLGHDIAPIERQLNRVLGGRELREILDGARDLSPLERVRWNLKYLRNETFRDNTFIFNISALTNVKDFVRPLGLHRDGTEVKSLLTPALTPEGELDWTQLSLDALFLYVTSIDGFKSAPAGLYDTQVDLAGTKTPLLDKRPLSASLTSKELEELWSDEELQPLLRMGGIRTLEELSNTPRSKLTPSTRTNNIDAIDLGEFRGHHWNPFVQALRPPEELSKEHAVWNFPRKAFMRAVLQVLALRNLIEAGELGESERYGITKAGSERKSIEPWVEDGDYGDVAMIRTEGDEPTQEHLFNLYNLGVRAATYGLVANSARTGLGTAPPLGRALETESLYYQALRVYSYIDWEFHHGLLNDPSVWPLPRSLVFISGRFSSDFTERFPEEKLARLGELKRAFNALAPGMKPLELRRLREKDYESRLGTISVKFSESIRENLWKGTKEKLAFIERYAYERETVDVHAKLRAMLGAFTPLCSVATAAFHKGTPEKSSTRFTMYLPAFHNLFADDFDRPRDWFLVKGLREFRLPRPLKLSTAEITHIRYLEDADLSENHGIKLELRRDFDKKDQLTTVANFGTFFNESSDDLFAFDSSHYRDSLQVVFRPNLAIVEADNAADRAFKEAFNRVFGSFEIEARIHQLTLHYQRISSNSRASFDDDAVFRPRFSLQESRISFRVHRYVDNAVERLPLTAAGFNCESTYDGTLRYHCWRDFWTWDHLLEEFFAGRNLGSGRMRLPKYFRERFVEQLVGSATKTVLDRSIAAIEDAIDKEVSRIVDDNLKHFSRARSVLIDRLHDGLF